MVSTTPNILFYDGLNVLSYQSHQVHIFTNSEELEIKSWTDKTLTLQNDEKEIIEIDMKYATCFKPAFAMTVHKVKEAHVHALLVYTNTRA